MRTTKRKPNQRETNQRQVSKEGRALRRWRKRHGLSQEEVAEQLGVTATTVSRWEKGQRVMSAKKYTAAIAAVSALADEVGVSDVLPLE